MTKADVPGALDALSWARTALDDPASIDWDDEDMPQGMTAPAYAIERIDHAIALLRGEA